MMRASRWALAALVAAGCAGPRPYVRPGFEEHPPRRVAVLPFVITYPYDVAQGEATPALHAAGRDMFRKTFYYALTPYGYQDVSLQEVDAKLVAAWGPLDQEGWRQAAPQALGAAVGADALVYGDLNRIMYFATPLYTETSLDASLRMVDAATGEVLWRQQVRAAERGGALMQQGQVVDLLQDQARSFHPDVKFLRVADDAVARALQGLPNPVMAGTGHDGPGAPLSGLRLAVLPLEPRRKDWRRGATTLRRYLTASLQDTPFQVLEIQLVDAALGAQGWREGGPLPEALSLAQLADTVGADLMLRGTVTNWGKGFAVVESWVKAGLELELVDPRAGTVIWSDRRKNVRHAGILKIPTGYKSIVTAPLMGLQTDHLERVATHLARSLVADLEASPAVAAYLSEQRRGL